MVLFFINCYVVFHFLKFFYVSLYIQLSLGNRIPIFGGKSCELYLPFVHLAALLCLFVVLFIYYFFFFFLFLFFFVCFCCCVCVCGGGGGGGCGVGLAVDLIVSIPDFSYLRYKKQTLSFSDSSTFLLHNQSSSAFPNMQW